MGNERCAIEVKQYARIGDADVGTHFAVILN